MEKLLELLKTSNIDISESDLKAVKKAFNEAVETRVEEKTKLIAEKADEFSESRIQEEVAKQVAEQKALMEKITNTYCEKKALTIAKKADRKVAEQMKKLENAAQRYIVEYFDKEFEKKYGEELEQIEENVLTKLDQYLEHVITEKIDPSLIETTAVNETYAPIVNGIQSLFQEQFIPLNASGKKKMKELTQEKSELEESLKNQVEANFELKENNKILQKAKLIAEACIGMSTRDARKVRDYFETKGLVETKANLPGFVRMLKEREEDMRERDPMLTERVKPMRRRPMLRSGLEDDTRDFVKEKFSAKKQDEGDEFLKGAANWLEM